MCLAFMAFLVSVYEHKDLCVHKLGPSNIVVHRVYSRVKMLLTILFVDLLMANPAPYVGTATHEGYPAGRQLPTHFWLEYFVL